MVRGFNSGANGERSRPSASHDDHELHNVRFLHDEFQAKNEIPRFELPPDVSSRTKKVFEAQTPLTLDHVDVRRSLLPKALTQKNEMDVL